MIRLIRSEVLKLRTTPGPWIVLAVTMAFTALGILGTFAVGGRGHTEFLAPTTVHRLRELLGAGASGGAGGEWMAAVAGALCVTTEFRHKVITTTLLVAPRRERLLAAKSVASILWAVLLAIASLVMVAAMGIPWLVTAGGSLSALLDQSGAVLPGLFAAFALLALFGVGFGTLVKNQVGAVLAIILISFIVEPIIDGIWPWLGRWLPSAAAQAVAGGITHGGGLSLDLLSWWLGTLVLIAWGIVPIVVGYFTTFSRDVT